MAVSKRVYRICEKYFSLDKRIAELGAQFVTGEEWGHYGPPYFKEIFPDLNLVSFDMTGEFDSIQLNLSEDLPSEYAQKFDIVTNFGTTEHVQNQYVCWKNAFRMLVEGGIMINEIPKKGHWEGHCKFYFDESAVASMQRDFEILEMQDIFYEDAGNLLYFVLRKKHNGEFITSENDLMSTVQVIENYNDKQGS
jgi:hypothetical protein